MTNIKIENNAVKARKFGSNFQTVALCDTPETAAFIGRAVACHDFMVYAIQTCLKAERARKKKLLPGSPASTYTQKRIDILESAIRMAGVK